MSESVSYYCVPAYGTKENGVKKLLKVFVSTFLVVIYVTIMPAFAQSKININTADVEALKTLNGVGEARAEAILQYRKEHGPFRSLDDLKEVRGIKDKVIEDNKSRITFGAEMGQSYQKEAGDQQTTQESR